jgi:hypothetical protein
MVKAVQQLPEQALVLLERAYPSSSPASSQEPVEKMQRRSTSRAGVKSREWAEQHELEAKPRAQVPFTGL